ncbi:MAG: hypothetical protein M3Q48_15820 [Actinomycetota bacterium]|nr:hypothetical protein [Actinomycetota bacterium]
MGRRTRVEANRGADWVLDAELVLYASRRRAEETRRRRIRSSLLWGFS